MLFISPLSVKGNISVQNHIIASMERPVVMNMCCALYKKGYYEVAVLNYEYFPLKRPHEKYHRTFTEVSFTFIDSLLFTSFLLYFTLIDPRGPCLVNL